MLTKTEIDNSLTNNLLELLENKTIYKYSNFKTGIERIILARTLKFSHPSEFNDPFDCNEDLIKINIPEKLLNKTIEKSINDLTPSIRKKIKEIFKNPDTIPDVMRKQKNNYQISCFSKLNNEVLMWSHYADKHQGVCIGFNFPHRYENKFILCPIRYFDKIQALDGNTDTNAILMYWLTTKSSRWNYEKEVRAISHSINTTDGIIDYNKKYIREIIFGCNVNNSEIKEAIVKMKNSDINLDEIILKKMLIDKDTFLLKEKIINYLSIK